MKDNIPTCLLSCGMVVLSAILTLVLVLFFYIDTVSESMMGLGENAKILIKGDGCTQSSYSKGGTDNLSDSLNNAVYILGGTQKSLLLKFDKAVDIYQSEKAKNMIIASEKGITEFSQSLGRNLTNDEWIVTRLTNKGVKCEDITFIRLPEGIFGTLKEAKTMEIIAQNRNINKLLLVCSAYHCNRVQNIFSAIFENTVVELGIYSVDEKIGHSVLVKEYLKYIFYDIILIPLEHIISWREQHQKANL